MNDFLLTEFDMEDTARRIAARHREEYIREGEERQREAFLARAAEAVSSGALTAEEASRLFGFDVDEIQSRLEEPAG